MKKLVMILLAMAMILMVGCGKTSSDTKSALTAEVDVKNALSTEEKTLVYNYFKEIEENASTAFNDFKVTVTEKTVIVTGEVKVNIEELGLIAGDKIKEVVSKEEGKYIDRFYINDVKDSEWSANYIEALFNLVVTPSQDFTSSEINSLKNGFSGLNLDTTNSKAINVEFTDTMVDENKVEVEVNVKLTIVKKNNKIYVNVYFDGEFISSSEYNTVDDLFENSEPTENISKNVIEGKIYKNIWK